MLLEIAYQIVRQRERQYNAIIADMYEMALLSEEWDIAEQLRQEAWDQFDGHLIALLLSIDLQFARDG